MDSLLLHGMSVIDASRLAREAIERVRGEVLEDMATEVDMSVVDTDINRQTQVATG